MPNDRVVDLDEDASPVGHRQRVKSRFLASLRAGSVDSLHDYEYLELLLFHSIPRRDVKPLAKKLLNRFGTVGAVLSASPDQLSSLVGPASATLLKAAMAAATWMLREKVLDQPILGAWPAVLDYCMATMGHLETECFRVLFLNQKNRLVADEVMQRGTVDQAPVYPREIASRALEFKASAIVMVHNHPSGDPNPSQADIAMTTQVREALRPLSIALHDHLIISSSGWYSFKSGHIL